MAHIKRLPYGISDFRQLRRDDLYYVDKTQYIQYLENAGYFLFLIRPRRFGKSLFLSMLRYYYDINEKGNFQNLFNGLWIAGHPTSEMGRYQVVFFDYSRVGGRIDKLEEYFESYCGEVLNDFADRYEKYYFDGFAEAVHSRPAYRNKLDFIQLKAKERQYPLYLIIDEYDNFTNTVLNEQGEEVYHALTHASGFYRDIFKQFKGMFDRILMMGVSPVTLDDVTSGYNIATNITTKSRFNMMLGFSETDVREMIRYYKSVGMLDADEDALVEEMRPWYDNYCFSEDVVYTDPKMFNCDMVTYFMRNYIEEEKAPRYMIDPNTRTDYTKMRKLIQLDKLDGDRRGILHEIAEKGYIYGTLEDTFPAAHLTDPKKFVSLLFYYGMLTITGLYGAELELSIPNNNVRKQYYDYLLQEYQTIYPVDTNLMGRCFTDAALKGEWRAMMEFIMKAYHDTTAVRSLIEGERNLQGFMNAYLNLNPYYMTAPEVELNHGYCDFFLMPEMARYPMIRHSYIIELKYLSMSDTDAVAEHQWNDAVRQIREYGIGGRVRVMTAGTELHLIVAQVKGYDLVRMEAVQLKG